MSVNYLISIHSGSNPHFPWPRDPYEVATLPRLEFSLHAITGADESQLLKLAVCATGQEPYSFVYENLQIVEAYLAQQARENFTPSAMPTLYSVHPRSVLCRLLNYWAVMRGFSFPILTKLIHADITEMLAQPAILAVEERFAFSPMRCAVASNFTSLGVGISAVAPGQILCQALRPFLR